MDIFIQKDRKKLFYVCLCLCGMGFLLGCLYVGYFSENSISSLSSFFMGIYGEGAEFSFLSAFTDIFVYALTVFLFGFSLYGFLICGIVLFIKSVVFGVLSATAYVCYGIDGAMYCAVAIMPYAFLSLLILVLLCVDSMFVSYRAFRGIDRTVLRQLFLRNTLSGGFLLLCCFCVAAWQRFIMPLSVKYICSAFI